MAKIETTFIRPKEEFNVDTGKAKVTYDGYQNNPHEIELKENLEGDVEGVINDTFKENDNNNVAFTDNEGNEHELITSEGFGDALNEAIPAALANAQVIKTTWSELKALRDGGNLIAGSLYRITDYNCTTTQENTRSAGHQFDIVVMALDSKTLAERAWAMPHEGDTYLAASNLKAWRLLYSLENDTKRFAWADPVNGKGVIYRMIDEHNNDCPYDFKNIQFKRWAVTGLSKGSDEMKAALIYDADANPFYFGIYDSVVGDVVTPNAEIDDLTNWAWHYTFHGWRKDADGELTPYDKSSEQVTAPEEFKQWSAEEYEEAGTTDICKDNILGHNLDRYVRDNEGSSLYGDAAEELPNNVFMSMSYCFYNEEEESWEYSFDETYSNRLGDKCYNNTFGNSCYGNTFGNYCYNNTFGNGCNYNTFGNYCYNNTFGNDCYNNTFGNGCYGNTFGNDCYNNTFGNGCYDNTFGNNNFQNTFGNNNFQNTFGNNFEQSSVGDGVNSITVSKDYVKWIIIENGNQKITITSNKTTSSSAYLQNFLIALGVNNSNNTKTISHNSVGDAFRTVYQNENSTSVDV